MVGQAVAAIVSGQATTVLVFRSLNGRIGPPLRPQPGDRAARVGGDGTYDEFFLPYGLLTPGPDLRPHGPAPHARVRHEPRRTSGRIALACRATGPTPTPTRRCTTAADDGRLPGGADDLAARCGCSTSAWRPTARARSSSPAPSGRATCAKPPALIRAVAPGHARQPAAGHPVPGACCARTSPPCRPSRRPTRCTAGPASGPATSTSPSSTTASRITVLLQLEDYGFCAKGEGGAFVVERRDRARRQPADQHRWRPPVGGVHPRHEPHRRRRAPDPRHESTIAGAGRRGVPRHVDAAAARQRPDPAGDS